MKLTLLTITVFLFISFSVSAQVRGTTWGESMASVKKKEKAEFLFEDDNSLGYRTTISALDVDMQYSFTDRKLSSIVYLVTENYIHKNQYIHKYEDLKEQLTKKYGDPINEETEWIEDRYKNRPSEHGYAISIGQLKYSASWELEDMDITIAVYGENYKIALGILYTSNEYHEERGEVDPAL